MITPKFKLDQNDDYLFINIRVPYAKVLLLAFIKILKEKYILYIFKYVKKLNEVDVFAESNDFRFYCKPYYLR